MFVYVQTYLVLVYSLKRDSTTTATSLLVLVLCIRLLSRFNASHRIRYDRERNMGDLRQSESAVPSSQQKEKNIFVSH